MHCWIASMPAFSPVPKARDTKPSEYTLAPAASGPYKLGDYARGASLQLVRNEHWDAATDEARTAGPDTITFKLGQDATVAAQALIGAELGAARPDAARRLTRTMVRWGLGFGVVTGAVLALAAPVLPGLFTTDPTVQAAATVGLWVLAAGQPVAGYVFVLDGVLIGAGDARYLALAGLVNLVVYAPALWVLAQLATGGFGWTAVWPGPNAAVPDAVVNGDAVDRLPGNAHLTFPGCEGDSLLMLLDARGIECSTGSACSAGVPQASHVLLAMGCDEESARHSLRFSLGHTSSEADVDAALAVLPAAVERARQAALASSGGRP